MPHTIHIDSVTGHITNPIMKGAVPDYKATALQLAKQLDESHRAHRSVAQHRSTEQREAVAVIERIADNWLIRFILPRELLSHMDNIIRRMPL